MATRRPNFNRSLRLLLKDVCKTLPEFAHIRPSRILVVAGEARRASRGTVKPLTYANGRSVDLLGRRKPVVRIGGKRMLYSITLRPLFFRNSTARTRIGTVLHELYHIHPRFDGTLDDERRHASAGPGFARQLRPLLRRYLKACSKDLLEQFAYDGEVRVLHWLERPSAQYLPGTKMRRVYTEEQLFEATVRMITRKRRERPREERRAPRVEH